MVAAPAAYSILGQVELLRGRLAEAAQLLDDAVEGARLSGNVQALAGNLGNRSLAALAAGEVGMALATAEECVELTRGLDRSLACAAGVALAADVRPDELTGPLGHYGGASSGGREWPTTATASGSSTGSSPTSCSWRGRRETRAGSSPLHRTKSTAPTARTRVARRWPLLRPRRARAGAPRRSLEHDLRSGIGAVIARLTGASAELVDARDDFQFAALLERLGQRVRPSTQDGDGQAVTVPARSTASRRTTSRR